MQLFHYKKVWFFLAFLVLVITTVCFWNLNRQEKKVYANGRIVEHISPEDKIMMIEWGKA